MGKHKQSNRQAKNIFKVAGARSLKLKNKAKSVSTQLKKVSCGKILTSIRTFFLFVLSTASSPFSPYSSFSSSFICAWKDQTSALSLPALSLHAMYSTLHSFQCDRLWRVKACDFVDETRYHLALVVVSRHSNPYEI